MNNDKLSKLKSRLFLTFESLYVSKKTFEEILETLKIPIVKNEPVDNKDENLSSYFKIGDKYFSELDYISLTDKIKISNYIRQKRNGRKKMLGGIYHLNSSPNVCRIVDFDKLDGSFIYIVEMLCARLNSTEFFGIEKINERDIGRPYFGVMTPYIDGNEHNFEKWISPIEISKEEFY